MQSDKKTEFKKKKKNTLQIGRQEIKQSAFADSMILYIENPKDTQRHTPWKRHTHTESYARTLRERDKHTHTERHTERHTHTDTHTH